MCLEKEKEEKEKLKESKTGQKSMPTEVERVKHSYPAIKKPSPASFKQEPSPHPSGRLTISAPPVKRGRPRKTASSTHSTPPIVLDQQAGSRRSTINSLTAPAPVFGGRLPAPHVDIRIPEPPSRSPTPPTTVVPHHGRGNKYTQKDREYFIKFIGWRLKHDPTLTRNDLCDLLAEKVWHFFSLNLLFIDVNVRHLIILHNHGLLTGLEIMMYPTRYWLQHAARIIVVVPRMQKTTAKLDKDPSTKTCPRPKTRKKCRKATQRLKRTRKKEVKTRLLSITQRKTWVKRVAHLLMQTYTLPPNILRQSQIGIE